MTREEQKIALQQMRQTVTAFYANAVHIGVHPFIEFAGLMHEYVSACENAHQDGIDFSDCNRHVGQTLPLEDYQRRFIAEKLECIFSGSINIMIPSQPVTDSPEAVEA